MKQSTVYSESLGGSYDCAEICGILNLIKSNIFFARLKCAFRAAHFANGEHALRRLRVAYLLRDFIRYEISLGKIIGKGSAFIAVFFGGGFREQQCAGNAIGFRNIKTKPYTLKHEFLIFVSEFARGEKLLYFFY